MMATHKFIGLSQGFGCAAALICKVMYERII
jgi:hypothetical protein